MAKRTQPGWKSVIVLLLLACALGTGRSAAQDASDIRVKSAFLFNFAKFVEWPAEAFPRPGAPIMIGVFDDRAFTGVLEQTVRGKAIDGRPIRVKLVETEADVKDCQILYVSSVSKRSNQILAAAAGRSVLTVGDSERFAHTGGIIRLFVQDARMRFEINTDAAQRAHLTLSARLLALARIVRGINAGK